MTSLSITRSISAGSGGAHEPRCSIVLERAFGHRMAKRAQRPGAAAGADLFAVLMDDPGQEVHRLAASAERGRIRSHRVVRVCRSIDELLVSAAWWITVTARLSGRW